MSFDFANININDLNKKVEVENKTEKKVVKKTVENKQASNKVVFKKCDESTLKNDIAFLSSKIKKIQRELEDEIFVEREDEINMILLGLISGTNVFLHGPAGTGKSLLAEEISNRVVNSKYFRILMSKTTEPGEIFGPVSLSSLKNDRHKVNTEGKLPECNIAFLDEIFKANSAILNGLLTITNEKKFFNEGVQDVPLISVIAASNEYYDDDSLIPLYDRFLLRWNVTYINEQSNRLALFKRFLNNRKQKSSLFDNDLVAISSPYTTITLDEVKKLNEMCKVIDIDNKVLTAYAKLFISLERENIVISDRRKNEGLKILQASAILNGRTSVETLDFCNLKYVLWKNEQEIPLILDELKEFAEPYIKDVDAFMTAISEYDEIMNNLSTDESNYITMTKNLQEIQNGCKQVTKKLTELTTNKYKGNEDAERYIKDFNDNKVVPLYETSSQMLRDIAVSELTNVEQESDASFIMQ